MRTETQHSFMHLPSALLLVLAYGVLLANGGKAVAQTQTKDIGDSVDKEIVSAVYFYNSSNTGHIDIWKLTIAAREHREATIQALLRIFNDPKSRVYVPKCVAAYYLGEMRAAEAADSLAAQITLRPPPGGKPYGGYYPVETALVAIGNPSIPGVIRNLAQSDDAKTREISLQVLCGIDGDKDVAELRLRKALVAEKDTQNEVRLQSAIKAIPDLKLWNWVGRNFPL